MSAINGDIAEELKYLRMKGVVNDAKRRLFKDGLPCASEFERSKPSGNTRENKNISTPNIKVKPQELDAPIQSTSSAVPILEDTRVKVLIDEPEQAIQEPAMAANAKEEPMARGSKLERNVVTAAILESRSFPVVQPVKETGDCSKVKLHSAATNMEMETSPPTSSMRPVKVKLHTTANPIRKMLANLGSKFEACLPVGRRRRSGETCDDADDADALVTLQQIPKEESVRNRMSKDLESIIVDGDDDARKQSEDLKSPNTAQEPSTSSLEEKIIQRIDVECHEVVEKQEQKSLPDQGESISGDHEAVGTDEELELSDDVDTASSVSLETEKTLKMDLRIRLGVKRLEEMILELRNPTCTKRSIEILTIDAEHSVSQIRQIFEMRSSSLE